MQEGWKGRVRLRDWEGFFEAEDSYPLLVCSDVKRLKKSLEIACENADPAVCGFGVMMTALLDRYPIMQLEYGHTMADNAPEMPNVLDKTIFQHCCIQKESYLTQIKMPLRRHFPALGILKMVFAAIVRGETLVEMGNETLVSRMANRAEIRTQSGTREIRVDGIENKRC